MDSYKEWKKKEEKRLKNRIKNGKKYKCKKSLYKSTYKSDAFTKGEVYVMTQKDKGICLIVDNNGNEFTFTFDKEKNIKFYDFYEYFYESEFHEKVDKYNL